MDLSIREAQLEDLDWIVQLNQDNTPQVGELTRAQYDDLEKQCIAVWIAETDQGERLGFVMLLAAGRDYESPNYQWFENHIENYIYVDRIAVTQTARGKGVGLALYAEALDLAESHGASKLAAEVNLDPPNPISMAFHEKLGFEQVGEQVAAHNGRKVAMLVRPTLNSAAAS
jgi:predicted GNAT superfamily acetyltransferase